MFSSFTQIGSYNDQQICRAQLGPRQLRSHAIALLPLDYATEAYSKSSVLRNYLGDQSPNSQFSRAFPHEPRGSRQLPA